MDIKLYNDNNVQVGRAEINRTNTITVILYGGNNYNMVVDGYEFVVESRKYKTIFKSTNNINEWKELEAMYTKAYTKHRINY